METAPKMYTQFFGTGTADSYQRNMDGWRDSFNFLDLTLESLRAAEYIGGMRISMEDGIKYGSTRSYKLAKGLITPDQPDTEDPDSGDDSGQGTFG